MLNAQHARSLKNKVVPQGYPSQASPSQRCPDYAGSGRAAADASFKVFGTMQQGPVSNRTEVTVPIYVAYIFLIRDGDRSAPYDIDGIFTICQIIGLHIPTTTVAY